MTSHWNNLMAVDYSSIPMYKVFVENTTYAPLLGSNFQIHNGIGMHMGLGWTVAFNILNSIVNVCNDVQIGAEKHALETDDYQLSDANSADNEKSSNPFSIDPKLLPNLRKGEPPFHHFPNIRQIEGGTDTIRREFEKNVATTKELCHKMEKKPEKSVKCPWYWFFNQMTGFRTVGQVNSKMNEVLISNEGWAAEGKPIQKPRTGWYTHRANSLFSIKIENVPVDTKYVVILSMKSYVEKWVGSKLAVSSSVVKSATIPESMNNRASVVDWNNDSIFRIDGYHDVKTSVHFPHKIPIQGGGAKAGESLLIDLKLVGGKGFKIAGIAVCAY
mmetsp:Transcript_15778/g.45455  ORF Transcript_15778/g.45455 Transcript_15778/m.45455 type:complete len:330 (-) Transcript_15778:712-1701(-)